MKKTVDKLKKDKTVVLKNSTKIPISIRIKPPKNYNKKSTAIVIKEVKVTKEKKKLSPKKTPTASKKESKRAVPLNWAQVGLEINKIKDCIIVNIDMEYGIVFVCKKIEVEQEKINENSHFQPHPIKEKTTYHHCFVLNFNEKKFSKESNYIDELGMKVYPINHLSEIKEVIDSIK
jgi:hypothetical protein